MDITKFNIGTPVIIKTDDDIYDSYISAITLSDENFVYFKSGSIRTTLLDKLKAMTQGSGNKLDVSGGLVTGIIRTEKPIYAENSKVVNEDALKNFPNNITWTTQSESNVDYNDFKKSGMYFLGNNCLNAPDNRSWVRLIVNGNGGQDISQIACVIGYNLVYYRTSANGTWGDWAKISFTGITESGSNSNGSYIKYDDGTMICYLNIRVTDQAINSQYAGTNIYFGTRVWTFPQQFINDNVAVTCGTFRWSTGGSWGGTAQPSKSEVQLFGYDLFARATGTDCYISAIAIGRWK